MSIQEDGSCFGTGHYEIGTMKMIEAVADSLEFANETAAFGQHALGFDTGLELCCYIDDLKVAPEYPEARTYFLEDSKSSAADRPCCLIGCYNPARKNWTFEAGVGTVPLIG